MNTCGRGTARAAASLVSILPPNCPGHCEQVQLLSQPQGCPFVLPHVHPELRPTAHRVHLPTQGWSFVRRFGPEHADAGILLLRKAGHQFGPAHGAGIALRVSFCASIDGLCY